MSSKSRCLTQSLMIAMMVVNTFALEEGLQKDLHFGDHDYYNFMDTSYNIVKLHFHSIRNNQHSFLRHDDDKNAQVVYLPGKSWDDENNSHDNEHEHFINSKTVVFKSKSVDKHTKSRPLMDQIKKSAYAKKSILRNTQEMPLPGWIPSSYPDPVTSPRSCRIPPAFFDNNTAEKKVTIDSQNTIQNEVNPNLLFCDPDEVLSDSDIETIGSALLDFNSYYARDSIACEKQLFEYGHKDRADRQVKHYDTHVVNRYGSDLHSFSIDYDAEGKVSSLGGSFLSTSPDLNVPDIHIEIGVAVTEKIDVSSVLHEFRFYSFEDGDSMIDDAAQLFASYLHNKWFKNEFNKNQKRPTIAQKCAEENLNGGVNGILIFLSVEDKVCFISSGNDIGSILPWWRLEKVVNGMKENLQTMNYSAAIIGAIRDLSQMLNDGPPTLSEKIHDFIARFGLVFLFSMFTFILAVCAEVRERHKRYELAEINSRLDDVETEKAKMLQKSFRTDACPICLESFDGSDDIKGEVTKKLKKVDSFGIPVNGTDGQPIKMLRCGHMFDASCWNAWVHSGQGDPFNCPVCRQNVSKPERVSLENDSSFSLLGDSINLNYGTTDASPPATFDVQDEFGNDGETLVFI